MSDKTDVIFYTNGTKLSGARMEIETVADVGVIMGSRSDWPCMKHCCDLLENLGIPFEYGIVSAHRTPGRMGDYAANAETRCVKVIIACAGGSAHLPGMVASETLLPVLGVAPKKGDEAAMWSMVKMPSGIPLSFIGFDEAGAKNAALFAARMLALNDRKLFERLCEFQEKQSGSVPYSCHD